MGRIQLGQRKEKKEALGEGSPHHGPRPGRQRREAERGASRGCPLGLMMWHWREAVNAVCSSPLTRRSRRQREELEGSSGDLELRRLATRGQRAGADRGPPDRVRRRRLRRSAEQVAAGPSEGRRRMTDPEVAAQFLGESSGGRRGRRRGSSGSSELPWQRRFLQGGGTGEEQREGETEGEERRGRLREVRPGVEVTVGRCGVLRRSRLKAATRR